jgi:hypothetical protein
MAGQAPLPESEDPSRAPASGDGCRDGELEARHARQPSSSCQHVSSAECLRVPLMKVAANRCQIAQKMRHVKEQLSHEVANAAFRLPDAIYGKQGRVECFAPILFEN